MNNNQQHSNRTTATKNIFLQLLQFKNKQSHINSNACTDLNFSVSYANDTKIVKRSKRSWVALGNALEYILFYKGLADLGTELVDTYFPARKYQLTETTLELQALERSVMNHKKIQEVERYVMNYVTNADAIAKDYWAINRGNHDLLLGNLGLLCTNTGLLIGVAFMLMNINSKLDRNYEAILRVEAKVDRNYEAILRLENKVDRNLEVMLSRFKILEHNLTNVIERGFKEVIDFVRQTRIEGVTSELITFIKHFIQEQDAIKKLTHDEYVTKLEEVNGILHRLQNSRMPQSGSLHTLLYNIINQRFAIPENSHDSVAFTALGLLCSGTETYTSVMSFLLEEYSYLANFYYQQNDLEKYNHYFSLLSATFNDFENSLAGNNGLIDEVIHILNVVMSYDFIKDEREDVLEFASKRIYRFNSIKSKITKIDNLSQEKSGEKIKYNFSNSQVKTPIGNWEDRRKVSYAIQLQNNGTNYPVGEWSTPARVYKNANPFLDIGTDPKGRTRLVFRKFDNDKPELVGVIEDSKQKVFRDINRDLYNAILEPNEELAINEMETFIANGADIVARYERGRQAIHAAAETGNINVMLALINKGADINVRDITGYAPIHVAAEVGYEDFIKDIVSNGANVNAKTNLDRTALHIAAEKGYVNTVDNLMQTKGIDINTKDQRGFTPLHTAASFGKINVITSLSQDNRTDMNAQSEVGFTPLHIAVIAEYNDAVEALLMSDRVDVNAKTKSGLTALHFVSLSGNLEIAKLITRHNGVNINEKSADGWTPLHLAINSKQENVALELLFINNIEINTKGKDDLTPLHLAASSGQKSIVLKLLDKGGLIEDVDKYGYTPLHFAIETGDLDLVTCLVERGANLYAERKDGYTSLSLAAYNGELNIVQFLVNNRGVDVNTENKNGMIPIDFAASNGYFDIIEFLIDKNAIKNSALHWAAYGGHLNIVKYLADEEHFDLNKKDKYGNIPLHNAALQGHLNVVKYFVDEKQVDLNIENNNGYTPFLFAVLSGSLDTIKYFIDEKNIDLNSLNKCDNNGSNALHLSALNGNLGTIKYLIRKGANVNALDDYNNTPLFLATSRGHLAMVKYFIQKGANFKVTNNYGNTPLHFAAWNGRQDVVKYFFEKGVDLDATNGNGDTALHVSASVDITKYLVEKGANSKAINYDGYMPLHVAAANGILDITNYLLEQGISIHTRVTRSKEGSNDGKTLLHLSAQSGKLSMVEYLIRKGADVSSRDNSCKTSRDLANQNNHTDVVKVLEEEKLNINLLNAVKQGNLNKVKEYFDQGASLAVKDKNGSTLLEIANRNIYTEIAEFLEQKELDLNLVNAVKQSNFNMVRDYIVRGANLEIKDTDGHSLSHLAAQNYDIKQLLIQAKLNLDLINAVKQDNLDKVKHISREASLETTDKNGNTLLHLALSRNHSDTDIAKYLIKEGADINATNKDNSTPLHIAASNGKLNIVKHLIEKKGTNHELKDKNGNTPLSLAAQGGHLDIVKYLTEKGANLSVTNENGNTSLHEAASLDIVKYLIENGANIRAVNRIGFTLFHVAASNGKLDVVKFLVEEKEENLEVKDNNDNSPLDLSAQNGHIDTVKYLVGKGADASSLDVFLVAVRVIIDERSIAAQDSDGNTSLHLAALSGFLGIVKYIYIYGVNLYGINLYVTNKDGRLPLHIAADMGYLDIAKYLVEEGVELSATDNQDANPLHLAAASNNLSIVKYLVEKGANINSRMIKNNYGTTALHLASKNGNLDMIKYLIKEGAYANIPDKQSNTPICYAALNDHLNVVEYFIEEEGISGGNIFDASKNGYLGIIKYLMKKGADVNSTTGDIDGRNTPLHLAAQHGKLDVVKYLVEKSANLSATNSNNNTPLHLAAQQGKLDVVEYLLNKGADVNAIDSDLNTPVHLAAESGNLNVVQYLIRKGAYINAANKQGITPLCYAGLNDHLSVVKYFIEEKNISCGNIFDAAENGHLGLVRYFIEVKGVSLYATEKRDGCPNTILHSAAEGGHLQVVSYLLEEKGMNADIKRHFCNGLTPTAAAVRKGKLNVVKYLVDGGYATVTDYILRDLLCQAAWTGHIDEVKYFVEKGVDVNSKHNVLHYAVWSGKLDIVEYLVSKGADVNLKNGVGKTPLDHALWEGKSDIANFLRSKGARRSRRSIENDSSVIKNYQVTNSASRQSSWINVFVNSVKGFIYSPFKPCIGTGHFQPSKAVIIQDIDTCSALLMLNIFIREITGEKYVSTVNQSMPISEARGYALSIIEDFEKVVDQAAINSKVSMSRLDIDFVDVQREITRKVMGGKFEDISLVLSSYVRRACPGKEAGCPGKLSPKKFDKFMNEFNKRLCITLGR